MNIGDAIQSLESLEDDLGNKDDSDLDYATKEDIDDVLEDLKDTGNEIGYDEEIPGLNEITAADVKSKERLSEIKKAVNMAREQERETEKQQQVLNDEIEIAVGAAVAEVEIFQLAADATEQYSTDNREIDFDQYNLVWKGRLEQENKNIDAKLDEIHDRFSSGKLPNGSSLKTGDLVAINKKFYRCKQAGFQQMEFAQKKERNILVAALGPEKGRPKIKRHVCISANRTKGHELERERKNE